MPCFSIFPLVFLQISNNFSSADSSESPDSLLPVHFAVYYTKPEIDVIGIPSLLLSHKL